MTHRRSPWVRLLLAFMAGIGLAMHGWVRVTLSEAVMVFAGLSGLYLGLVAWQWWRGCWGWSHACVGLVGLAALASAGVVRFVQSQALLEDRAHILHHDEGVEAYEGVLVRERRGETSVSLTLRLRRVRKGNVWEGVKGRVVVSLPVAWGQTYRYGEVLRVEGSLRRIGGPRNPYGFDYARWAARRGIYHRAFVMKAKAVVSSGYAPPSTMKAMAWRVRAWLAERLDRALQDERVCEGVLALVLGMRGGVDKTVHEVFAVAGVLHILAVSGLHVGMLYVILLFLLGLLGVVGHRRRWWRGVVILAVLWGYAFVTALSPSVVRAVAMMSWATLARLGGRRYDFWNGLALTALGALWYDPMWLQDAGFQLSYLAVVGIRVCYRPWSRVWQPRLGVVKRVWQMVALALSVQVTTLPLSLYYFHAFPTYFLLGNLVAVPAASLILGLGLLCCVVGRVPWVGSALGWLLGRVVTGLYRYAGWLAALPCSQVGPFWPSPWEVGLGYGVIVAGMAWVAFRKFRYLPWAACCALALGMCSVRRWRAHRTQKVLTVYCIPKRQVVSLVMGWRAIVFHDGLGSSDVQYRQAVQPSLDALGVQKVIVLPLDMGTHRVGDLVQCQAWHGLRVMVWKDTKVAWLGQTSGFPPYRTGRHTLDVLIVDGYRLPTLAPWLRRLRPKVVVLGTSLTSTQRRHFKQNLAAHGIPCHDLWEKGAFVG